MQLEENLSIKNFGKLLGFSLSVFIFFSIFYTILNFLNKIPEEIEYKHILILIVTIILMRLIYLGVKKK